MITAMAGAAAVTSTGTATAMAKTVVAAKREIANNGEDSSTTGNKVIDPIAHSETISSCVASAATAGNSNGRAKALSARRRSGSRGHNVSRIAATLGRASNKTISVGTTR